jgi:hemerythrin-like domain-containing protein
VTPFGLPGWRKTMSDITTFLRADRIACDRLFRRVENAVRRRSWLAAFGANARFQRALNQHLLMEEQVLFKALEQYTSEASKPIVDMLREHQQLRHIAATATAAVRRCHAQSFFGIATALRLMVREHCTKEEGIVLLMADHFLRPAARFLIDAMRAVEMPANSEYSQTGLTRIA